MTRACEEVIEFIAGGTSPDDVAAFRPSDAATQRVVELVQRETDEGLSADEESELEHYLRLEHIMRLAKARARQHLSAP